MIKLKIFYRVIEGDKKFLCETVILNLPESLAEELLHKKVRIQMKFFIENLALLQGYEHGEFLRAQEVHDE